MLSTVSEKWSKGFDQENSTSRLRSYRLDRVTFPLVDIGLPTAK